MRLLIVTQKIDRNDPILGFFHRWAEEFAKHCESVVVICLQEGEYHFPENVHVLSLGKEEGGFRILKIIRYIVRFYIYIFRERKNYDAVFVHMNQEYVLLGGLFWKMLGKKITMWRNHAKGSILTRMAVMMSHRVFCTSPQSYTAQFNKTKIMPVGIDTEFFKPDPSVRKKPNSILFLGRIAPVKNVDVFVESLNELQSQGIEFSVTMAGAALPQDSEYKRKVRARVAEYRLGDKVKFVGAVTQGKALRLYKEHELYVNLTPSGSMDKTIFEAMACGSTVVSSNKDILEAIGDNEIKKDSGATVSTRIKAALEHHTDHREYVVKMHSLGKTVKKILESI